MRTASDEQIPKLYHYESLNVEYLADTLIHNRVHFSNPANFNDPWDCAPKYSISLVASADCIDQWRDFLLSNAHQVLKPEELEAIHRHTLKEPLDFLEDCINSTTKHSRAITAQRWRVYCLTQKSTSQLMWAHYANHHKGICLEFDATVPVIGRAFKVAYSKDRPIITCDDIANPYTRIPEKMFLIKSVDWTCEEEFRVLCRTGEIDKAPTNLLCKTAGDFLDLPPGAISSIIVGSRANYDVVKKLVQCCSDIPVHRAHIAEESHDISIV